MTGRRKMHRPAEIVVKLCDADAMLNAGKNVAAVLQALEVSDPTLERCRAPVRRDEVRGRQEAKAPRRREPAAEAVGCRPGPRHSDA
jgi:hypothetical protein